jgi:beta-lactamase class A
MRRAVRARRKSKSPRTAPPPPPAGAPPADSLADVEHSLYENIQRLKQAHRLEKLGIAFYDSHTTLNWSYNADALFHAASTIKLAVLVAVYAQVARGDLTVDAPVHVRNRFTSIIGDKPFMIDLGESDSEVARHLGRTMSVEDLAYEMITKSSNLATNLLIDVVGVPAIQRSLDELKIDGILMLRGVSDMAAYEAGQNNLVTANGVLQLLRAIAEGRAYSPEVCAQMLEILLDQRYKTGIPAGLPGDAQVAHKTGNISTVHHDAGIVYLGSRRPYFLVILTQFPAEVGRGRAVAEVSKDVFASLARLKR